MFAAFYSILKQGQFSNRNESANVDKLTNKKNSYTRKLNKKIMEATIELSIYPLHQDYKNKVKDFIKKIKRHRGLRVESNGMSTQIFGQYDDIMEVLRLDIRDTLEKEEAMVVLKIGKGILRFDESSL